MASEIAEARRAPWLKFYSSDWRADPGLRMCSYAARGLWVDLLTLMHEAEPYGHLLVSGCAPTARDLAGLLGGTEREIAGLLAQLEAKRVFSRNQDGSIYSRRMVRDREQAEKDRANGKRGGNPKVKREQSVEVKGGVNPPDNPTRNPEVNGGDKAQRPEARDQKESKRAPASAPVGMMPSLADPPSRWLSLGDKSEVDNDGIERPVVGGYYVDGVARQVCDAARIDGLSRSVDWRPMIGWLRDGIDPNARIVPVIARMAARPGYSPPRFLSYFDQAVREGIAA
jgi:hypothetical protein